MKLLSLKLRGFRSFVEEIELEFEPGAVFVLGKNLDDPEHFDSNGSGKTSLLASIPWALYGQLPTGVKKDDVINLESQECFVEVTFEGLIIRRSKRRGMSEALSFFWNEQWHEGTALQEKLTRIIGITPDLFFNSIWIDRESKSVQFLFATPANRLAILEEILGDSLYANAKKLVTRAKTRLEANLGTLKARIEELSNREDSERGRLLKAKAEYQKASARVSEKNRQIQHRVARLRSDLQKVEAEAKKALEGTRADVVTAKIQKLEIDQEEANRRVAHMGVRVKDLEKFLDKPGERCPTCYQEISEKYIKALTASHQQMKEIYDAEYGIAGKLAWELKQAREELIQARQRTSIITSKRSEITKLRDEIQHLQDSMTEDSEVEGLAQVIEDAEKALIQLKEAKHTYVQQVVEISNLIPRHKFWEDGFGSKGIRNLLLDDIRILLGHYISAYSAQLTGEQITLEIPSSDRFDIILHTAKGTRDIGTFSRGEVWRSNLVVLLAIRKVLHHLNSTRLGLIFLDDSIGDLDNKGGECIIAITDQLSDEFDHVFATLPRKISTIPEDCILTVQRLNDRSELI